MSQHPKSVTEYLIATGWLPVPSITEECAFQHPELSRVPEWFAEVYGSYAAGLVRWHKQQAVAIQLVIARQIDDGWRDPAWLMTEALAKITERFTWLSERRP